MSKMFVLIYGFVSYFIGVAGFAAILLALIGWIPFGFFLSNQELPGNPIVWNFILVALWGFFHSLMARPAFKTALTRIIPEAAERSTYILVAGITSLILIGLWKAMPGYIWNFENPFIIYSLWALFAFGWAFMFGATFAIDHFDLFGLRQVYFHFKNRPRPPLNFVKRAMYKYVRHPIQTGILIGVWATPVMSKNQIILSIGFTTYIVIGLWLEERDLIREHGEEYISYKQETGAVFPKLLK